MDKWISSTKSLAVALLLNLFKNGYPCLYSYDQLFLNLRWSKDISGDMFLITGKTWPGVNRLPAVPPISDSDTANMQIRTLTRGLGMYSVKRLLMNTQG